MNITYQGGIATLPDGTTVNLLKVQAACNSAFQETGEQEYATAADEVALITGLFQGPHGGWEPVTRGDKMKVDLATYNDDEAHHDLWAYVIAPAGDEWRFHFFLDKETGEIHEGEPCYAEDQDATFDDTSLSVPLKIRELIDAAMPAITAHLKREKPPVSNGLGPVPESAEECEFGDEEYQWRLREAGF